MTLKERIFLLFIIGSFLWIPLSAQDCPHADLTGKQDQKWFLDAFLGFQFGHASYITEGLSSEDGNPENISALKSELIFPIDIVMTGISFKGPLSFIKKRPGNIEGFLSTNLKNPFHRMTENAWINGSMVTFIQSNPSLRFYDSALKYDIQLYRTSNTELELSSRFSFQHIQQDMTAYAGWMQDVDNGQIQEISKLDDYVINYRISYISLQTGVSYHVVPNKVIQFSIDPTAGIIYASDRDKHFLKSRVTEARAYGFIVGLDAQCVIQPKILNNFSLFYRSGLSYSNASGKQTASWYKDGSNVTAGSVFSGIPQRMISLQYHISLGIGYVF